MKLIAVDLGTTNIKTAVYDRALTPIAYNSVAVEYDRRGSHVEFYAEGYVRGLLALLAEHVDQGRIQKDEGCRIALTGQAETLVVLGKNGRPLIPAISWMDERSEKECQLLAARLTDDNCRSKTGQAAVLPTWPATKILWLRENQPEIFRQAAHYVLLKDYVAYALTGTLVSDMSIATFSFYFDIYQKEYWPEMLELCGISPRQLPQLREPCTAIGAITAQTAAEIGLPADTAVNIGTLDHFAGMVGCGNIAPGGVSLSTGTVMALAAMAEMPAAKGSRVAMHYGFLPDTYVMLPVVESGGVSLEWFKRLCLGHMTYQQLNEALETRPLPNGVLFLPYLVGTNAPEFDREACGVFAGLRAEHDGVDMAYAIMEGVAHILRRNLEEIRASGTGISQIIATGGGSNSTIWCQLQADVTGIPVMIPREKEAACLGAAIIAAVDCGLYPSLEAACKQAVTFETVYYPRKDPALERKYRQFCRLYQAALEVSKMD